MMFAKVDDIRKQTAFDEVESLDDEQIESFIKRAERWIYRATEMDYSDEDNENILQDLETAMIHLVDLLWMQDQPDIKDATLSGMESEKIGSYSYNKSKTAVPGQPTGIPELDGILESLKFNMNGVNFFRVGGPHS